jgi:type VI secretion system secreted protein VgrG
MHKFTQDNQFIAVTTPLQKDDLLLERFVAQERVSGLFSFQLELLAENETEIPFEKLLGQNATVELRLSQNTTRFFNGIISRFSQGERDTVFTSYRAELVPKFWILTRSAQSRIFPGPGSDPPRSVSEILKETLKTLDTEFDWEGTFKPRNYCVQYRETDFNFASRLMEEEGIYYFFKHSAHGHKMVVTNKSQVHPTVDEPSEVIYELATGGFRNPDRVYSWAKIQELRSGLYTLRDYSFQLPANNLEASKDIDESMKAGEVTHTLKLAANENIEIFDYPGEYSQRFDGIDKSGAEVPDELKNICAGEDADNKRTVDIRMKAEALPSLLIRGSSNCGQFLPGHNFTLQRHFNADGKYILTSVDHFASVGNAYRSGNSSAAAYQNNFTCIPFELPFRPFRLTPKPLIQGTQTAVVVGPDGNEIFTDKFGRVKVQFRWDRKGNFDADSSCWVRVAQIWAGKRWGASFWPRIGQEVIVAFEEGDPDRPMIVGSVYNADQMPPYLGDGPDSKHKRDNKVSGIKTNTTPGGQGYNEIRFDDTKEKEQVFLHAQRNLDITTNSDSLASTGGDRHQIIGGEKDGKKSGDQREMVYRDKHLKIHRNQIEQIGDSMQLLVGGIDAGQGNQDIVLKGTKKESIAKDDNLQVKGSRNEQIGGGQSLSVGGDQQEKIGKNHLVDAGQEIHLKAGMKIIIEAGVQISLKGPGGFVDIGPAGVTIQGTMVLINSGGSAGSGTDSKPAGPATPIEANPTAPIVADDSKSGQKSARS